MLRPASQPFIFFFLKKKRNILILFIFTFCADLVLLHALQKINCNERGRRIPPKFNELNSYNFLYLNSEKKL